MTDNESTCDGVCPECNNICIEYCDNDCGTFYCNRCFVNSPSTGRKPLEFHFGIQSLKKVLGHDLNCHSEDSTSYEDDFLMD